MARFDWPALLRVGVRGLGLRPAEFWDLTPAEFRLMLGEETGGPSMGRDRLDELMAAFPDTGRVVKSEGEPS